jgi:transposase
VKADLRKIKIALPHWIAEGRFKDLVPAGLARATAMAATVTDPTHFRSGRQFAVWLGLTPLNHSSGGKERLGRISKLGHQYAASPGHQA